MSRRWLLIMLVVVVIVGTIAWTIWCDVSPCVSLVPPGYVIEQKGDYYRWVGDGMTGQTECVTFNRAARNAQQAYMNRLGWVQVYTGRLEDASQAMPYVWRNLPEHSGNNLEK